jgi:hypothetical protein
MQRGAVARVAGLFLDGADATVSRLLEDEPAAGSEEQEAGS